MKKQYIAPVLSALHVACSEMIAGSPVPNALTGNASQEFNLNEGGTLGGQNTHEKIWDNDGSIWE